MWPPGSADTVCPHRPLRTQVQATALGQDGSDRSRDLATLIFDFGGHAPVADAGRRPPSVYQVQSS